MYKYFCSKTHPKVTGKRKPDIDPDQPGLLRNTRGYVKKKEVGDCFEKKVGNLMRATFQGDDVYGDIYFETGEYSKELLIYRTIQIDHIVVSREGVFCIEDKFLSNETYKYVSGGATAKTWTTKKFAGRNGSSRETNGLLQNSYHRHFWKNYLTIMK